MRFRNRRATAARWALTGSVLGAGEIGVETDTRKWKFGDGATPYPALPWPRVDLAEAQSRFISATNLVSLGADPAGGDVDARPALDQVLVQALNSGQAIGSLPMGAYRMKSTYNPADRTPTHPSLVLAKPLRGFTWFGGWGKLGYPPSGGNKYFGAPEFVWYGPVGAPMWELDSVGGAALIGIGFRGRGAANRAGIGLNITQRGQIIGSGLHLIERCTFNDLDVGVKFGEGQVTGGGNCDTTTFRDVGFQACDVGVLLSHQQNLVYNFEGTSSWVGCATAIKATAGGYLNVADFNANGCGGTDDAWMLDFAGGKYIGTQKISRGRIEGNCKQFLKVRSRYTEVLIEGLTEAQDPQGVTMFDLTGGQVTLLGGKLTSHSASAPTFRLHQDAASGGLPCLRLFGVRLDTDRFLYEEWFGHDTTSLPAITVRDCEDQFGRPIPSFSTRLESGLPVPLRARTTDGATDVSTTLLNNGADQRGDNACAVFPGAYRVRMNLIGATTAAGNVTQIVLRAAREFDVVHTGSTLSISTPETIGTDYNPNTLTWSVGAVNSYKYLRAVVRGQADTTIDWRAEFRLVSGAPTSSLLAA